MNDFCPHGLHRDHACALCASTPKSGSVEAGTFAFVEKVIYDRPEERLVKQWLEPIAVVDFYKATA